VITFRTTLFTKAGAPCMGDEQTADTKQQFDAYTRNLGRILSDPEGFFTIEIGGATMIFPSREIGYIIAAPVGAELD